MSVTETEIWNWAEQRGPQHAKKLPVMERFKWHVVYRALQMQAHKTICFLDWRGDFCTENSSVKHRNLQQTSVREPQVLRLTLYTSELVARWGQNTQIWVKAMRSDDGADENWAFKVKASAFCSWYLTAWHIPGKAREATGCLQSRFIQMWAGSWFVPYMQT